MPHALVVEDDPNTLYALAELVEQEGFTTSTASTLADARMNVSTRTPDLVLLDLMLPDGNGIYLLKDLEALSNAQVVLITGHATLDSAVEAFRLGAHDFMTKPVDIPRLRSVLAGIAEKSAPAEVPGLAPVKGDGGKALRRRCHRSRPGRKGRAPRALWPAAGRLAADAAGLRADQKGRPHRGHGLLTGESGTGKDVVARDDARPEPPRSRPVPAGQLRRDLAQPDRERAVRPREAAASPAPSASTRASSSGRTAARCSWTRSPRCRWTCRSSCCGCWRPAPSCASAATTPHGNRRARDRRDQPRSRARRSATASCARTCSTGCTSSRSTCRRCASARTTSTC